MAEVQDDEQWLYGEDREDSNVEGRENEEETFEENETRQVDIDQSINEEHTQVPVTEATETNGDATEERDQNQEESQGAEQNGDKSKDDTGDDSSSDDEPTVTIGKIVKQPDILRPPPPTHRAAPTSGLKDEDFNSTGKVNGVPAPDFNLAELEEKPWRKPGADLSDYFNYGFTEDTWIKYCERQKAMRTNESGIGLTGLGINVAKGGMMGSSNIPVSIINENSKYGGIRKPAGMPVTKIMNEDHNSGISQPSAINTIQVMTADRRTYSNKVMGSGGPGGGNYDDMDFGGHPYGADFFSAPPPSFYTPPPPNPWGGIPNIPPPGWAPDGLGVPPPAPHHRTMGYFDEDSMGPIGNIHSRSSKDERELEKMRDSRDREHESRERDLRHQHGNRRRSRSRSQSKSRHRKRSRTRSRSRSPSHRHKRKKSKREREID